MEQTLQERLARCSEWPSRFAPDEWAAYSKIIASAQERGIRFALGGAVAAMTYAGGWRNTKDLDIYVLPQDRDRIRELLLECRFVDYYDVLPYDRRWIFRAHQGDIIVDTIWAMANQRANVDESWFSGPEVEVSGLRFRLLAPEYSVWAKLYIIQRDRSDWPDCLNIIYGVGPELDWRKLLAKVGPDLPVLAGLVSIFTWISPKRARDLPGFIWDKLHLHPPSEEIDDSVFARRVAILDSRPWFHPLLERKDPTPPRQNCNAQGAAGC